MSIIGFNYTPDADTAIFAGLNVRDIHKVSWQNQDTAQDHGHYWVALGGDGVIWVADDHDRMAAAVMSRVQRYLFRGIARRTSKLTREYLGNGMIPVPGGARVINFGANVGEVAMCLANAGAHVLAIEPDPNVIPALRANAVGRTIDVLPLVSWKEDGDITLYIASEKADTSVIDACGQPVTVPGRRLDTITAEFGIGDVHLILGDAEGAEPEVLEGARETLKRTKYISLRNSPERHGKPSGDLCIPILRDAGFEILLDGNEQLIARNTKC